jgi:hypothetical protein
MKKTLYVVGLLMAALACTPKNEEVQEEHVDVAPPAEALDTISSTEVDGVSTDENDTSTSLPMPQPVMQLLTKRYMEWEQPTLADETSERSQNYTQEPTLVRGDFNGDTLQDLAIQLQQNDYIVVVAALQTQEGTYELQELKRDILFNDRGRLRSLYYLYRIEQGELLHNDTTNQDLEAPHDAVALGIADDIVAYLYENGEFRQYMIRQ